jgi:site-specific DNA-methyltransferase (adenine-specific)
MVSDVVFSRKSDEYITPEWLFEKLNSTYNFVLDPATTLDNPLKTPYYFTKEDDGLKLTWPAVNTFINPPYSQVGKWVAKANEQYLQNYMENPDITIVMLVAARTDTKWFHDIILKAEERKYCDIRFLKGRIRFRNTENSSPFPSMLVMFRKQL